MGVILGSVLGPKIVEIRARNLTSNRGALLGDILGHLDASGGRFGVVFGALGVVLEPLLEHLEPFWRILGPGRAKIVFPSPIVPDFG